jgi:hypothetical protein
MTFEPGFYRAAAACSILSAVTTLLLIFLPELYPPAGSFEERMARVHLAAYRLRAWAYFVHPFLVLMAALGVAMRIRRWRSAAAVIGLLGFALWAFTEAGQQALTLFAFDKWRLAYATADEATREMIRANTQMYDGLWDAMYFLILVAFAIGNLSFGQALVRGTGLMRLTGAFFLAAVALTLFTNLAPQLQWWTVPEAVDKWSYPAIQPLGRIIIGIWLWRAADESRPLPSGATPSATAA